MPSRTLPASFAPNRRWKYGANVVLSTLALVAIVLMVNYLAARHFRRFRWAADSRPSLSPVTLDVLHSMTNKVRVVVFYNRTKPLYDLVVDLLDQYRLQCSKLEVEYVDYERSPARAKLIQTQYDLSAAEDGDRVIFDSNGRRRIVYAKDLSDLDYSALLKGQQEVKRTGFKGEQLFTSALYTVLDPRPPKVYFLTGHKEHDPGDTDDRLGYSNFAKILQESQVMIGRLDLTTLSSEDLPNDCHLLIIANPTTSFTKEELSMIQKYLSQGGRLMALLSVQSASEPTGLEKVLERYWGVAVGRNFVYDPPQGKAGDEFEVIVTRFANHPIMNPLAGSRLLLIQPRSVGASTRSPQGADAPKVIELAMTSPNGIATLGAGRVERQGAVIPLMVAVEQGAIQGITADRGTTRMVIVGESQFLSNSNLKLAAHRDFARNAVNWLLSRDALVQGVGVQPIKEYRIIMTSAELAAMRWLLVALFPSAVLFVGFIVWLRRRA